jgi:hypothetical protein
MELETIFVGGAWAPGAARLQSALKLGEKADMLAKMQISVGEVTLENIAIRILRP